MTAALVNPAAEREAMAAAEQHRWHLGHTSRRIIEEIAEVVLPADGRSRRVIEHCVRYVDGYVPHLPALARTFFPLGLRLIQWGTILTFSAFKPFTLIARAARRNKYLETWSTSRFALFRALMMGVRGLILSGYYAMPVVYRKIGYTPDEHLATCRKQRAALIAATGDRDHHTRAMLFSEIGHPEMSDG